jgi:predicted amidohydrolase
MGSLALQAGEDFHNRLVCAHPDGTTSSYDKRHLFSYAGEDNVFTPGEHRLTTLCGDGWKVCPMVCYDLRFPAWSRNTDAYDVLIYVANWPSARVDAWNTLLKARAIENQCFTIGVNRTGSDSNGIDYSGSTRVYDMAGGNIAKAGDTPHLLEVTLNHQLLSDYRAKYNFLPDQDRFIFV